MNFGDFKKVNEDENSTLLLHPDGHHILVAKNGLSHEMKGHLDSIPMMASGGDPLSLDQASLDNVSSASELPKSDPESVESLQSAAAQNPASAQNIYDVKKSDLQGSLNVVDPVNGEIITKGEPGYDEAIENNALTEAKKYNQLQSEQQSAEKQKTLNTSKAAVDKSKEFASQGLTPPQAIADAAGQAQAQEQGKTGQFGSQNFNLGAQGQPQQQMQDPYAEVSKGYNKAFKDYESSAMHLGQIEQERANHEADILNDKIQRLEQTHKQYQEQSQLILDQADKVKKDIENSHIDPRRYINNMDSGQTILTGIGMLLGGIGTIGNPSRANGAFEFLKDSINKDIDAQKSELGKKENLLSANLKLMGNLRDATEMTRLNMNDIMSAYMQQSASKSMGQGAMDRAKMLTSQYETNVRLPMIKEMAMKRTMYSGSGGNVDPAMKIQMLAPEHERTKLMGDVKSMQDMAVRRDKVLEAFDQVQKLNTLSNRITSPIQTPRLVHGIMGPVLDNLTKDTAGRVTPVSIDLLKNLFAQVGNDPKTNSILREKARELVEKDMSFPSLRPYGIKMPPPKPAPIHSVGNNK